MMRYTVNESQREDRDLKAIITGYVLTYPGLTAMEIVHKVRRLNLRPQPSTDDIFRMIDDIVDEYMSDFV